MPAAASFSLLPATLADAAFAADVYTDEWPDEPSDPILLRHEWNAPDQGPRSRHRIERAGRRIGYLETQHDAWELVEERYALIIAGFFRADFDPDLLAEVLSGAEADLIAAGTQFLTTRTRPFEEARAATLAGLGYRQDREDRWSELRLPESAGSLIAMAEASRRHCAGAGFSLRTLADVDPDRAFLTRLAEMSAEAELDVPSTVPIVPESVEAFLAELDSPAAHRDRVWVALKAGEPVGMSLLAYPPVRGNVWTSWTCTARSARGQGLARGLKVETLLQALELGVERVRTSNDEANAAILHLNQQLGYQPVPGLRLWVKPVPYRDRNGI